MRVVSSQEEFQWLLLVLMGYLLSLLPESFLWVGCLCLVLLVGLPHGALDGYLLATEARDNWRKFALAITRYIFLVLFGLLVWRAFPEVFWTAFFAAAVYHFGISDEHPEVLRSVSANPLCRILWILSRGTLLVAAPFTFHPEKISNYLSQAAHSDFALQATQIAPFLFGYAALFFLFSTLLSWRSARLQTYRLILIKHLVGIFLFTLLFAVADPLLSFTLYFCCHHSLNHTFRVLRRMHWPKKKARLSLFTFSLTVLATAFFFWVKTHVREQNLPAGWISASFVTLAALTFPHLIVVQDLHQRLNQRPFRQ